MTTDILMEYEEICGKHMGKKVAGLLLQIIENAPNVELVTRYYKWNLITADPDDNKFVDCAVAVGANYLVTNDKHFRILQEVPFPKVNVVTVREFQKILAK